MIKNRTVVKRNYCNCFTVFRDIDTKEDSSFRASFVEYCGYPLINLYSLTNQNNVERTKVIKKYIKEEVYECFCVDCCFYWSSCYKEIEEGRYSFICFSPLYCFSSNLTVLQSNNFELARSDCCVVNRIGSFLSCYNTSVCLFSKLLLRRANVNEKYKSHGYRTDYGIIHTEFKEDEYNWMKDRNIQVVVINDDNQNFTYKHEDGGTAIHGAVLNNNLLLIYILFKFLSADLNAVDDDDETPLHLSVKSHTHVNIKTFEYLLELGSDVNKTTMRKGNTPLHLACNDYEVNINDLDLRAESLVKHCADPYKKNKEEKNPLELASSKGNLKERIEEAVVLYCAVETDNYGLAEEIILREKMKDPLQIKDGNISDNLKNKVNHVNPNNGQTALHLCCHKGDKRMFRILVDNGACPDSLTIQDKNGSTSLHLASIGLHWNISLELINKITNLETLNIQNNNGDTPLLVSCYSGVSSLEVCEKLIERGVTVTTINEEEETVLHVAVRNKFPLHFIKCLLSKGADPNLIVNNNGIKRKESPFILSLKTEREDSADLCLSMLEYGADPNSFDFNGTPSLHLALQQKLFGIIPEFINRSVDVNQLDSNNVTALYLSCELGNTETCNLLLRSKADPNRVSGVKTPFHLALECGMFDTCPSFLCSSADLNAVDSNNNTVLHLACKLKKVDICTQILKTGRINPNTLNENGKAPLHIAVEDNALELCQALLGDEKVDVNVANKEGIISLQLSLVKKNKNWYIIDLLTQHGSVVDPDQLFVDCFQFDKKSYERFYLFCEFTLSSLEDDQFRLWFYLIQLKDVKNIEQRVLHYGNKFGKLLRVKDKNGRIAEEYAIEKTKKVLKSTYLWFNRFRVTDSTPMHVSPTCFVFRADDAEDLDDSGHPRKVALKLMMDKNHFIREVEVRENNFDSNYIINLKAKYPFDLDSIKRKKEERINIGAVYSKGGGGESILSKDLAEKMYCLVMPLADVNMYVAMKQERWAGMKNERDIDEVKHVGKQILKCLMHMHGKGVIHGDIKPLNLVRVDSQWRLIDMDASCVMSRHHIGLKFTTAYVPPEFLHFIESPDGDDKVIIKTKEELSKYSVSPEEVKPLAADPTFDIWAFGCVLYQLCNEDIVQIFQGDKDDNLSKDSLIKLYNWTNQTKQKKLEKINNRLAKNVIAQILVKDPSKRPSVSRILAHPFFSDLKVDRMIGEEASYHVFLSYRVSSDSDHVEKLYNLLSERGLRVWWDKLCLKKGENWEKGFCKGLMNSKTFVCLVSRDGINHPTNEKQNFAKLDENSDCDNVLLEYRLALELRDLDLIDKVFPLMIGDKDINDPNIYHSFFTTGNSCLPKPLQVFVQSVEKKLCFHMEEQALGMPLTNCKTVASVLNDIIACQGAFIEGNGNLAFEKAVDDIITMFSDENNNKDNNNKDNNTMITHRMPVNEDVDSLKKEIELLKQQLSSLKTKYSVSDNDNKFNNINEDIVIPNENHKLISKPTIRYSQSSRSNKHSIMNVINTGPNYKPITKTSQKISPSK